MLVSIKCDAFADDIRELDIKPGLNTILGSSDGSNAIGKTTFLWILDYIFGGQRYTRLMQGIKEHTDHQVIYFTFEFDGAKKYFYRKTDEPQKVFNCDAEGHVIEDMTIEKYREFLRQSYKLDKPGLGFNGLAGHFFRIYGGGNTHEWLPMKNSSDTNDSAVSFLMQLFGYGTILTGIDRIEQELNIKAFQVFLKKPPEPIDYSQMIDDNNVTINALQDRLDKLMKQHDSTDFAVLGLDTHMIDAVSKLQKELRQITRQYEALRSQMDSIEMNMAETVGDKATEFGALKKFFPGIELKALADIESFHQELREILRDEMQQEIDRLRPVLDFYVSEIERLKAKIKESGINQTINERIMSQCVSAKQRIEFLQAENDRLEHEKELQEERGMRLNKLRALADQYREAVKDIEAKINECLTTISNEVTAGIEKAPVLSMSLSNDLSFGTMDDTSEGTAFKNLVLYDLSLAKLSTVPVIIHDSNILKRIDDDYLEQILKHYQSCGSQVFIAFDKAESAKQGAKAILEQTTLLHMYDGHELFGQSWSKKTSEPSEAEKSEV